MGPIPDDWATEPLVQIGRWFSGGTPSLANKLYWTGNIPWVSPKDMKLPRLWDAIDHISLKAVSDGARVLPVGTVLMVIRGMILAHSFPVARLECPSACNQDMKALVTRADIDSNFVLFWLTANRQNLRSLTTESTHGTKRLPSEILFRQIICLPPLPEQRAIATALSDVDTLISGLDQLIAKKRDIKQATMQQLLTGQTRLPGFSGEWEVKRLGDVAIFLKGKGLPKSALSPFGEKPCIHYGELFTRYPETIGAIISRTNGSRESFRSIANDVLMPTSDVTPRGLAKASCIKVNDVILGGDILVIRPEKNRICGSYLSYVIRSEEEQVLQLVTGSTVFHLYGSDMKKFLFLMPPLDEQTAITTVLSDMDAELAALEQRRDKTRDMKQGMMQELLTGRIRLI
jgi:type I restriction enzyme S subunit